MNIDCDVLIAGAGPAGAALAVALAPLAMRVMLTDAAPQSDGADQRALALGLGSQRILDGLGVWPALADRATAIEQLEVTESGAFGVTRMAAREVEAAALGWVIGDRLLRRTLLERAVELGIERHTGAVSALESQAKALKVTLRGTDGDTQVYTRLLVAADGSDSTVCRLAGLPRHHRELPNSALFARLTSDRPHAGRAHERFTTSGPMALLPGPGPADYMLVWTLPEERAADLALLPAQYLAPIAQDAFGWRAGRFVTLAEPRSVRLTESWATLATGERVVAIGNAANTLHPIAAQGFNLGLRDVATLAALLAAAAKAGADLGASGLLAAYRRAREPDWRRFRAITGWLPRLFNNPGLPWALPRGAGLAALDLLRPAKRHLMRYAMGLAGPQNRLQRGLWP